MEKTNSLIVFIIFLSLPFLIMIFESILNLILKGTL